MKISDDPRPIFPSRRHIDAWIARNRIPRRNTLSLKIAIRDFLHRIGLMSDPLLMIQIDVIKSEYI
jgi:hypothetical protein